MKPIPIALLALSLAMLACVLPGASATTQPGDLATSAAATLAALPAPGSTAPAPGPTAGGAATAPPEASPDTSPTEPPPDATPPAPGSTADAPTEAPSLQTCQLVYTNADALLCIDGDGPPRTLANGPGLFGPHLSPDGRWVAYQVVVEDGITELWVAGADASDGSPRMLVSAAQIPNANPDFINSPNNVQWRAGSQTLIFDTRFMPVGGFMGPGEYINADLWAVDAASGAVTQLLPNDLAGHFAVSPDGAFIAISRPLGLDLVNADGANYRPDLVVFPGILTYAEYAYRPDIVWNHDSLGFTAAVPSTDPLAPDSHVTLYQVGVDGIVQPLSVIPGNFVFGGMLRAHLSPAGLEVVYSQNRGEGNINSLHRASTDGVSNVVVDEASLPVGWGWSPDSQRYAYTTIAQDAPGGAFIIEPSMTVQALAANLTAVRDLQWQDSSTLVFIGRVDDGDWGLYRLAAGGGQPPELLAASLADRAEMDVR